MWKCEYKSKKGVSQQEVKSQELSSYRVRVRELQSRALRVVVGMYRNYSLFY
jgi:hypothetical protein